MNSSLLQRLVAMALNIIDEQELRRFGVEQKIQHMEDQWCAEQIANSEWPTEQNIELDDAVLYIMLSTYSDISFDDHKDAFVDGDDECISEAAAMEMLEATL